MLRLFVLSVALRASPHFQLDLAITIDEHKIVAIRGDEAGSMGAGSESDENVKMQVAQLVGRKAVIGADLGQYFTRLQPILLCRSQDWVVSRQRHQKLAIRRRRSASP